MTREEFEKLQDFVTRLQTQLVSLAELVSSRLEAQVQERPPVDAPMLADQEQLESELELSYESRSISSSPENANEPLPMPKLRVDVQIYDTSCEPAIMIKETSFEHQITEADLQVHALGNEICPAGIFGPQEPNMAMRAALATQASSNEHESLQCIVCKLVNRIRSIPLQTSELTARDDAQRGRCNSGTDQEPISSLADNSAQLSSVPTHDNQHQTNDADRIDLLGRSQNIDPSPELICESHVNLLNLQAQLSDFDDPRSARQGGMHSLQSSTSNSSSAGCLDQVGTTRRVRFTLSDHEQANLERADAATQTDLTVDLTDGGAGLAYVKRDTTVDDITMYTISGGQVLLYSNNVYAVLHSTRDGHLELRVQSWGTNGQYLATGSFDRKTTGKQLHAFVRDQFGIPNNKPLHLALVQHRMLMHDDKTLWSHGIRNFPHYIARLPADSAEGETMALKYIGRGPTVNGDPQEAHQLTKWRSRRA